MSEPLTMIAMASTALAGLSILIFAGLRGWQGWLDLKRLELTSARARPASEGGMAEVENFVTSPNARLAQEIDSLR